MGHHSGFDGGIQCLWSRGLLTCFPPEIKWLRQNKTQKTQCAGSMRKKFQW